MIANALMRRFRWAAALLTLSAASALRAAGPDVLNQVPADAYGVVVVGNPHTFSNKLGNMIAQLSLQLPSTDLLGMATRSVGITQGFDANGSAALVLLSPPAGSDRTGIKYFDSTPPMVLLVPATNPSLMLEKFNPSDPDKDGIIQVSLPDNPEQKLFAVVVDKKWVAVSLAKEDMQSYVARKASFASVAGADTLKVFDANDMVIWSNIEAIGSGLDKWIDEQEANQVGMRDLASMVQGGDAYSGAIEKHMLKGAFALAREYAKDTHSTMITARLSDSGASFGMIMDFKADTPLAKFVAAQGHAGTVSLQGLPAGDYLIAGGIKWDGPSVYGVLHDVLAQVVADPTIANDKRSEDLKRVMNQITDMGPLTQGMSFMMLQTPAGGKSGMMSGAFLVDSTDPQKLLDAQIKSAQGLLSNETVTNDIKSSITVTPNALTVKDVPLAKLQVKMALRDETPDKPISAANRAAFEMVQKLYGEEGITMYAGVVGKHLVMIWGTELPMLESAITAAQNNADALGMQPEIAATKSEMVANPIAVLYMPLARWTLLGTQVALGREPPAAAKAAAAGAPPLVMSLGVNGRMVTAEVHVPVAAITSMQKVEQAMQQRGGVMPGGPLPNLP